ncbi:hypothetical protein ACR3IL_10580 [Streptococcus iniae]|nr:hypothetical protein BKX95_11565 [Streptococcus iniae]
MKKSKEEELQVLVDYLLTIDSLENLIRVLVKIIPSRFFYDKQLETGDLEALRKDLSSLIEEGRKKQTSNYQKQMTGFLYKEYQDKLEQSVALRRQLLIFGLLMQERDKQEDILADLIDKHHLIKPVYLWVCQENRNKTIKKEHVRSPTD